MGGQKAVRIAAALGALLISSCVMPPVQEYSAEGKAESLNKKIELVALELTDRLREFEPDDKTIAVTTFVDLDNLEKTSAFGRFVAEQLSSELYKLGFRVRELRQMSEVEVVRHKGEFAISRRTARLMKRFRIDAVATGTYTMVGDEVVVNARLLSVDTARVVSVGQMVANVKYKSFIHDLLTRESARYTPTVKVYSLDGEDS